MTYTPTLYRARWTRYLLLLLCMLWGTEGLNAQSQRHIVEQRLRTYFKEYTCPEVDLGRCRLVRMQLDQKRRTLTIHANDHFGFQPMRPETTRKIYEDIRNILPGPVNYYNISVLVEGKKIEELVPNVYRKVKDESRLWGKTDYKGEPWTRNLSCPYTVTQGLQGRHLAITPSHGLYYKNDEQLWKWQRPSLFGTREDLLSQSIVVPYLIPMLERAGAIVYSGRERDRRAEEVIIDNDSTGPTAGEYVEHMHHTAAWGTTTTGFRQPQGALRGTENVFAQGSARTIRTTRHRAQDTECMQWIPNIPETGAYAVYVSYQTLPESVDDATYCIMHKGGTTMVQVNQQMGGGTWTYVGTYEFEKGRYSNQLVSLTNESNRKGVVTGDAVRFGGGRAKVMRGPAGHETSSGMPRYYEGARYQSQWSGMPVERYANYQGEKDYPEDINSRSLTANYILGGSVYCPDSVGLRVPLELSLALHTDAGFSKEDKVIGMLGIYTTDYNHTRLGNGTLSRYTSRDLADLIQTHVMHDLSPIARMPFTRRPMWDRNYSESRLPEVPSVIIELLAHQNFADMRFAYDPHFKFTAARAIYKGILAYTSQMHNTRYVVQPLPVVGMAANFTDNGKVRLSWAPQTDTNELSAQPEAYVLYTRTNDSGWNNGQLIRGTACDINIAPDQLYSFKVTAVNAGGESFDSEVVCAHRASEPKGRVLIVNGFQRMEGPAIICNSEQVGFDLLDDPGVPYIGTTAHSGIQQVFDRRCIGLPDDLQQLGASNEDLAGSYIAGNTMDFAVTHGKAMKVGGYSFVSCGRMAFEQGIVKAEDFDVVDLYLGLQRERGQAVIAHRPYKAITPAMYERLLHYAAQGGGLLVSGAYLGDEGTRDNSAAKLLQNVLHAQYQGSVKPWYEQGISVFGTVMDIPRWVNPEQYAVTHPEILVPCEGAFAAMSYENSHLSAGVAYKGSYRSMVLGFPFESIRSERDRTLMMISALEFLRKP